MESVKQVEEFHEKFGLPVGSYPQNYVVVTDKEANHLDKCIRLLIYRERELKEAAAETGSTVLLRARLIISELREVLEAVEEGDLEHLLHEAADLQYVVDGLFVELGLQNVKAEACTRVHEANMSKLAEDGSVIRDSSGKVQKGPNFKPATMKGLV